MEQLQNNETLHTLVTEVERILNSKSMIQVNLSLAITLNDLIHSLHAESD